MALHSCSLWNVPLERFVRTVESRQFVMHLIRRASPTFQFWRTPPNMLPRIMDRFEMHWTVILDLGTRKHTNKIRRMVENR